jgi:WD40 repeat protein
MPVEQARGEPVDERADVYAVGAMLYHVLAARPPYEGASDQVLASVLAGPPVPLATRVDGLPRDLLAIVDKAMARAPEDRYASGKELAQDLSRFLTGQLVGAREYSRFTLIGRWLKKHRYIVGAVSILLAALAATAIVSARRIVRERNVAQARSAQLVLSQAKAVIGGDPTAAVAWLEQYPDFGTDWVQVQQIAADALSLGVARHVWKGDSAAYIHSVLSMDGKHVATSGLEGVRIWDAATGKLRVTWSPPSQASRMRFAPDGKVLWVGDQHGDLLRFDLEEPQAAPRTVHAHDGWVAEILVSPDGREVVTLGSDKRIRTWAVSPGDGTFAAAGAWETGPSTEIDLAIDDQGSIWASSLDGKVQRWRRGAPGAETVFDGHERRPAAPLSIAPDGSSMVTAVAGAVFLWRDGAVRKVGEQPAIVRSVWLGKDEVLSADDDGTVTAWGADGSSRILVRHNAPVLKLTGSRDHGLVASSDAIGEVRLWRAGAVQILRGSTRTPDLEFSTDGSRLLADSPDGVTRLWGTEARGALDEVTPTYPLFGLSFSTDGQTVFVTGRVGGVWAVDVRRGSATLLGRHASTSYDQKLFAHGLRLATGAWDGTVAVWTSGAPAPVTWKHGQRVWALDVAPDDRHVATADLDGTVLVHDLSDGSDRRILTVEGEAKQVLYSRDGAQLAAGGTAGTIHVKTLATGAEVVLRGHTDGISALAFSADGRTLYSASWDGTLRIWDLATQKSRVLAGHTQRIRTMALSPDGKTLASGSADRTIRLWDVATGASRVLRGHTAEARHVVFSPDGAWLASAGWDATVRLWHLDDGRSVVLRGRADLVHRVAFSPDGKLLASAGEDGAVGLWQLADVDAVPGTPKELRAWLAATTTAVIGPDETLATRP